MTDRKTQLVSLLALALLVMGGLWYFMQSGEHKGVEQEANVWRIVGEGSTSNNQETTTKIQETITKRYTNSVYGFSFAEPEGFNAVSSPYGDLGEIIFFEPSEATSEGWQIFIIPFDESGLITPERIRIDLPDLVMKNVRQATLADVPALVFDGENEAIGETYEIWFTRNGYLYQIMTYKSFENEMNAILQTWRFE